MSGVYFIGDLHFGHKNICNFRDGLGLKTEEEHREFLIDKWNKKVSKRGLVYILGDAVFGVEYLKDLGRLNGSKKIILGNHDLPAWHFEPYCTEIAGFKKYKEFWLSHAPIHPEELRGKFNIHGHVHYKSLDDGRYINVSCENVNYEPISLDEIRSKL